MCRETCVVPLGIEYSREWGNNERCSLLPQADIQFQAVRGLDQMSVTDDRASSALGHRLSMRSPGYFVPRLIRRSESWVACGLGRDAVLPVLLVRVRVLALLVRLGLLDPQPPRLAGLGLPLPLAVRAVRTEELDVLDRRRRRIQVRDRLVRQDPPLEIERIEPLQHRVDLGQRGRDLLLAGLPAVEPDQPSVDRDRLALDVVDFAGEVELLEVALAVQLTEPPATAAVHVTEVLVDLGVHLRIVGGRLEARVQPVEHVLLHPHDPLGQGQLALLGHGLFLLPLVGLE